MILQMTGYVVLSAYDLCSDVMLLHIQASFQFCVCLCFGGRGTGLAFDNLCKSFGNRHVVLTPFFNVHGYIKTYLF